MPLFNVNMTFFDLIIYFETMAFDWLEGRLSRLECFRLVEKFLSRIDFSDPLFHYLTLSELWIMLKRRLKFIAFH